MYALDAALKAADVRLAAFFGPPSETNFGGGLLTGSQSACKSACDSFGSPCGCEWTNATISPFSDALM